MHKLPVPFTRGAVKLGSRYSSFALKSIELVIYSSIALRKRQGTRRTKKITIL